MDKTQDAIDCTCYIHFVFEFNLYGNTYLCLCETELSRSCDDVLRAKLKTWWTLCLGLFQHITSWFRYIYRFDTDAVKTEILIITSNPYRICVSVKLIFFKL